MISNQSWWWKQLSNSCGYRGRLTLPVTVARARANDQPAGGASRGHTPSPPPRPHPCRKQGSRPLHHLSSDSLAALTLTNQPWVGLLFIYFLSWGLSRGLVWFWVKFTFHIYSEVWKESRKYQKSKFHFLELFLKEGSPTLSQLQGESRFVQCWGRGAHQWTKLSGRVSNPREERGKLQGSPRLSPGKGPGQGQSSPDDHTSRPWSWQISFQTIARSSPFLPSMFLKRGVTSYPTSYSCLNLGPFGPQIHADYLATWPLESQQVPPPAHQSLYHHHPTFLHSFELTQASIWL